MLEHAPSCGWRSLTGPDAGACPHRRNPAAGRGSRGQLELDPPHPRPRGSLPHTARHRRWSSPVASGSIDLPHRRTITKLPPTLPARAGRLYWLMFSNTSLAEQVGEEIEKRHPKQKLNDRALSAEPSISD